MPRMSIRDHCHLSGFSLSWVVPLPSIILLLSFSIGYFINHDLLYQCTRLSSQFVSSACMQKLIIWLFHNPQTLLLHDPASRFFVCLPHPFLVHCVSLLERVLVYAFLLCKFNIFKQVKHPCSQMKKNAYTLETDRDLFSDSDDQSGMRWNVTKVLVQIHLH